MSVLALVIILCFLGLILWLVNTKFGAMNATIKLIINIVVIVVAIVLVLAAFGVWDEVKSIQVPKI